MKLRSIKIVITNVLKRGFLGWFSNYKLISNIWSERFPQDAKREPLSILEKATMTPLLFVRGFSFVNIAHFFPSYRVRSEISEFYVVAWAAALLVLLWNPIAYLPLLYALMIYRLVDGINYRLCIIFVDRYMPEWGLRSLNRSLILLGINYFEIILAFAILYLHTQSISSTIPSLHIVSTPTEALYFSSMTILTLSFGDFKPLTSIGKVLVVLEPILGVLLIVLVVGIFLTGVRDIREKLPTK